ncbi:SMC-Scp complex subunit ScpB [Oscillospiraceae bacterium OttesenSCG-928-G22]|nr:SMC-Scp complex subunit ScpB [Oscillospiraceae bacterium OttesenSCG-928-G22]
MEIHDVKSAIEAVLFAAGDPVPLEKLSEILEVESETVERLMQDLQDEYKFNRRGLRILRLEESYQLSSAPEYAEEVKKVLDIRKPPPMSKAALEILSIVAYYQPVTRAYIDQIRGVDSSYTVGLLADRGLIEDCGFLEVPGRPRLFRTTAGFLRTFGISSVEELPELPDLSGETEGQMTLLETLPSPDAPVAEPEADFSAAEDTPPVDSPGESDELPAALEENPSPGEWAPENSGILEEGGSHAAESE